MKYYLPILFILFISCNNDTPIEITGGFNYPQNIDNKDTNYYFYPLKNIEPARDAFWDTYVYALFQPFKEPNLSIKPLTEETYRLTYQEAFGKTIIFSLTKHFITVKKGYPHLHEEDTIQLTGIERFHFRVLRKFPLDTSSKSPQRKHYYDSLTKLYPRLLDAAYFHSIYEKTLVPVNEKFDYSFRRYSITSQQYNSIIQHIKSSGFWQMPYTLKCEYPSADGAGFVLEANTSKKYGIVRAKDCPDDSSEFTKACQEIINMARMDKEVNLIWDGSIDTLNNLLIQDVELAPVSEEKR